MSYRSAAYSSILALLFCGPCYGSSLDSETVLTSCQKALDGKDNKSAAKECQFAVQWLQHEEPDSLMHAEALEKLADFLQSINGNLNFAVGYYQHALNIREKLEADSSSAESLQIKMATALSTLGKWAEAEMALKKALRMIEVSSLQAADVLNRLGVVQFKQQLLADAERSLRQALTIRQAQLSSSDILIAETYINLGALNEFLGKNQNAEDFYRKAAQNQESAKITPYPQLFDTLSNLAALLQRTSRLNEAEPYWKKALFAAEKGFGKESGQYAAGLNNLGLLAIVVQNFSVAEKLFAESLNVREKNIGLNNIMTAESANNLAVALEKQGKRLQAVPFMRQAAAITHVVLGANNPLTQERWNSLKNLESNPPPSVAIVKSKEN